MVLPHRSPHRGRLLLQRALGFLEAGRVLQLGVPSARQIEGILHSPVPKPIFPTRSFTHGGIGVHDSAPPGGAYEAHHPQEKEKERR